MTVSCPPAEANSRQVAGFAVLIDVRTPAEFRAVHAAGARLVPLDQLSPSDLVASVPAGGAIYLLCKGGTRACMAACRLAEAGVPAVVVDGGTDAWIAAGLPVVRGRATIDLERQVRIAAGMLVLTGVILGYTVHRSLFALSGAIGAGLTIAGITGTCLMGSVLARMPWNR